MRQRDFDTVKTERELWKYIAVAFSTPPEKRTKHQRIITNSGLCWAASFHSERLRNAVSAMFTGKDSKMLRYDSFGQDVGKGCGEFIAPRQSDEGDALRANIAGMFAAMTNEERRVFYS